MFTTSKQLAKRGRAPLPLGSILDVQEELHRDMHRLFDEFFSSVEPQRMAQVSWTPPVDVLEDDKEFILRAELPGVEQKDVQISLQDNTIIIKGEKKEEVEEKSELHHRLERFYGNFMRTFELPAGLDTEKVQAHYKNGILEIMLPKTGEQKVKTIEIKTS